METLSPNYEDLRSAFDALDDRYKPGRVLDVLCSNLRVSDVALAAQTGLTRQSIRNRRNGRVKVEFRDLWALASGIVAATPLVVSDVPIGLFLRTPAEVLVWLGTQLSTQFGWIV